MKAALPPATGRRRKVKPADDRRRELLDAAVRVFTDSGVAGATVADIAETAGVAKGTFYLYFDSKEHLLGALRQRHADAVVERAVSYAQRVGSEDLWSLADAFVEGMIDLEFENRDLVEVLCQEAMTEAAASVFADAERTVQALVAGGIRAGVDNGTFDCPDPDYTAALLCHAIEGAVKHAILYGHRIDRDRLCAAAKAMARKVLAPDL